MSDNSRQLAVLPRPRSAWQAIDAGMLLARTHYWKLLALWLFFAIPVVSLIFALIKFEVVGYWLLFLGWWFKPLNELPILMYLSRVLFNQPTSVRQALKETRPQLLRLFKTYLTLSRFSPARAMTAPVVYLEHQKGKARRKRVNTLTNATTRAYTLMLSWLHIEAIGFYVLMPILYFFIYGALEFDELFKKFIDSDQLLNTADLFIYTVVPMVLAALVGPFYVASGFLLYINRRMHLEAWDIEHKFEDLESKHSQRGAPPQFASVSMLMIIGSAVVITSLSFLPIDTTHAQESKKLAPVESIRDSVQSIYDSGDFGGSKTSMSLRFKKRPPKEGKEKKEDSDKSKFNFNMQWLATAFETLFDVSRAIVYLLAGTLIALVLWALLKFMPDSWEFARRKPQLELLDVEHHPLTKTLPTDIATAARAALKNGNHREAISLLYRGALRTVMQRHALSIPKSATERECQYWVAQCDVEQQTNDFKQVVNEWSSVAYANIQPTPEHTHDLIDFWASNFSIDAPTTAPVTR